MKTVVYQNSIPIYYNTKTAKHICGYWNFNTNRITELHINHMGKLFFAIYDPSNEDTIIPINIHQALDFIDKNEKDIKWFPNGRSLLQQNINELLKNNP